MSRNISLATLQVANYIKTVVTYTENNEKAVF